MKQYSITAKLWLKIDADSPGEAQALSKNLIDEAMIEYAQSHNIQGVGISKAKVIWAKENDHKD